MPKVEPLPKLPTTEMPSAFEKAKHEWCVSGRPAVH